jgi:hypothetical protein
MRSVSASAGGSASGRDMRAFAGTLTSRSSMEPAPMVSSMRFCSAGVLAM